MLPPVIAYLNGRFVPDEQAVVSIHDRGFLYGDALFETVRVYAGEPFLWREHMQRLAEGANALAILPPLSANEMLLILRELLRRNGMTDALARLTLTRGRGARGYSPRGADHPTFAIALYPAPSALPKTWRVVVASHRLYSGDRLARFKHGNKLVQIAARMEADAAHADEALLANERGEVVEGASTNLFWIRKGEICTAPPAEGILPGTTRKYIIGLLGRRVREETIRPEKLIAAEGVFLTSSVIELMEISAIDARPVARSSLLPGIKALYRKNRAGSNEACPPGNSITPETKAATTTTESAPFRRKPSSG